MALQMSMDISGVTISEAYVRIRQIYHVRPLHSFENVHVVYDIFGNKAARDALTSPLSEGNEIPVVSTVPDPEKTGEFVPNSAFGVFALKADPSDNLFATGYNYLKTLPEFVGEKDC